MYIALPSPRGDLTRRLDTVWEAEHPVYAQFDSRMVPPVPTTVLRWATPAAGALASKTGETEWGRRKSREKGGAWLLQEWPAPMAPSSDTMIDNSGEAAQVPMTFDNMRAPAGLPTKLSDK